MVPTFATNPLSWSRHIVDTKLSKKYCLFFFSFSDPQKATVKCRIKQAFLTLWNISWEKQAIFSKLICKWKDQLSGDEKVDDIHNWQKLQNLSQRPSSLLFSKISAFSNRLICKTFFYSFVRLRYKLFYLVDLYDFIIFDCLQL